MTEHRDPPEVHGHRGCRGLLPENTVPAFLKAAELGCDWIEMDVVASGDGQLVVSHEPWMSHRICLDANGDSIAAEPTCSQLNMRKISPNPGSVLSSLRSSTSYVRSR